MKTAALIIAGGSGSRAGGDGLPKQYRPIAGVPMLRRAVETFLGEAAIDGTIVVIAAGDQSLYADTALHHDRLLPPAVGGRDRQESVANGLAALAGAAPDAVLIHDAARPFASADLIRRVVAALDAADAVLPVLPVIDTLKTVDGSGTVTGTVPRDGLFAAETPQGFRFATILDAHRRAAGAGLRFTDDAAVAEWAGIPVRTVPGERTNAKLTTAADLAAAERRILGEAALALGDIRVGVGYDVHAFGPGTSVMLGGVAIAHGRGIIGHSDADVVIHALADALFGALAEDDIGAHFPPSDPQWKGVSSDRFLTFAVERVAARGGRIAHLDVAIVAEAPKIGPHRQAMRERLAAICGIGIDRVAVKATTSEGLGFIGRGEGIAVTATATVRLPFDAPR